MKCPACRGTLPALTERCPDCGAVVAPPVEGALAPKPRPVTPAPREPVTPAPKSSREKVEPLRDIPGLPKKERTWRDEVQERVRKRRKKRTQSSLPLFEQPGVAESSGEPTPSPDTDTAPVSTPPSPLRAESDSRDTAPVAAAPVRLEPSPEPADASATPLARDEGPAKAERDFEATPLSEEELADLPLRAPQPSPAAPAIEEAAELPGVQVELPAGPPTLDDEELVSEDDDEADLSLEPPSVEPEPLERPARVGERAQAAAVDAGILVVLGALVVYFTGRAARVDVASLSVSWPWLLAYLAFLGLFYAGYFTGTTGQTPGKMVAGLRVVDARGRPPGYARAALRAAAGACGTVLAGLGLIPMALDPARRALHDRLLRTRVVHR